jgi:hypothetical protein
MNNTTTFNIFHSLQQTIKNVYKTQQILYRQCTIRYKNTKLHFLHRTVQLESWIFTSWNYHNNNFYFKPQSRNKQIIKTISQMQQTLPVQFDKPSAVKSVNRCVPDLIQQTTVSHERHNEHHFWGHAHHNNTHTIRMNNRRHNTSFIW